MEINIDINDELLNEAVLLNPKKTTDEIVQDALELIVRLGKQGDLKKLKDILTEERKK